MPSQEYEDYVAHDLEIYAKQCVSYRPVEMYEQPRGCGCTRDVPIDAKATEANGGSRLGVALRYPCNASKDPLFECPWYEPTGYQKAADQMHAMKEAGRRVLTKLAKQLQAKAS